MADDEGKKRKRSGAPAASARAAQWWTEKRESAYEMLVSGSPPGEVAQALRIDDSTLRRWRADGRWRERIQQETEERRGRYAEALLVVDRAAVRALVAHVQADPHAALHYLQSRGILDKPTGRHEHEVKAEVDHRHEVEGLSTDELRQLVRGLNERASDPD